VGQVLLRKRELGLPSRLRAADEGGGGIFLFAIASRPALGPIQPPTSPIGTGGSFPGGKVTGVRS
jgi:hypothetical protein